jgi:hypothetical protein
MRPHAYHNPVLLTSPLCRPGDQVRVNIRSPRGFGVRAPGQQRIYAAGAYYPGLPLLGPVCIRPPSLHSPVSNPGPPEAGMCISRMQRLDTTPYHHGFYLASAGRSLVLACAARGALCAGVRLAALKREMFVDIGARRMYDSWHRI